MSILVTVDKKIEKCLARQLPDYFRSLLSPFMFAYRRGYSCEAILLRFIEDWRSTLDNKCVIGAVSMEPNKAFENFSKYIRKITKKVGNQKDVLSRLKNTLSFSSKMCLMITA